MKIHPAAALFPALEGDAFNQFAADIQANGQRETIKTWQGQLIDGRNRLRACEAAKIAPKFEEMKFADDADVIAYIVSENIQRRHLDASQRAVLGEQLRPMLAAAAKERQHAAGEHGKEGGRGKDKTLGPNSTQGFSPKPRAPKVSEQIASMVGVSASTQAQAKKVAQESPELLDKVAKGDVSLNAAYKAVKGNGASVNKPEPQPMPKPTTLKPGEVQAQRSVNMKPEVWDSFKTRVEQEGGGSVAAKAGAVLTAYVEGAEIKPESLPKTAQQKLEAVIKQEVKKLHAKYAAQFAAAVSAEVKKRLDEYILPRWRKEIEEASAIMSARKGVITLKDYNALAWCLHPDRTVRFNDAEMTQRFNDAARILFALKRVMVGEKELPTKDMPPLPSTPAEWEAARERVRQENIARAKRAAATRKAGAASNPVSR